MRAQKLLPRTVLPTATMSPSLATRTFPPAEAFRKPKYNEPELVVDTWASLQPPETSALAAFAHRIGLASVFPSQDEMPALIRQACTHSSFAPLHLAHYPDQTPPPTNGALAALGNSLMGLFAAEHIHASYPHLPTRVLKAAVSAYVGPNTCAAVAQEIGAAPLLRWSRTRATATKDAILHPDAMASIPRALTGLIYHYRSLPVARKFVHTFFLSREVNLQSFMKFRDPKLALSFTVEQFGRERPISRLLRETGRLSNSPIFVVGIFTGSEKLGEGFGSSLKMAEYRAAEDALHRLYLTRTPSHLLSLPTSTFPTPPNPRSLSVFDKVEGQKSENYVPGDLGSSSSEIQFGAREHQHRPANRGGKERQILDREWRRDDSGFLDD